MRNITPAGRSGDGEKQLAPLPRGQGPETPGGEERAQVPTDTGETSVDNVEDLISQIVIVAEGNNKKSGLLSKIIHEILEDFKVNINKFKEG